MKSFAYVIPPDDNYESISVEIDLNPDTKYVICDEIEVRLPNEEAFTLNEGVFSFVGAFEETLLRTLCKNLEEAPPTGKIIWCPGERITEMFHQPGRAWIEFRDGRTSEVVELRQNVFAFSQPANNLDATEFIAGAPDPLAFLDGPVYTMFAPFWGQYSNNLDTQLDGFRDEVEKLKDGFLPDTIRENVTLGDLLRKHPDLATIHITKSDDGEYVLNLISEGETKHLSLRRASGAEE